MTAAPHPPPAPKPAPRASSGRNILMVMLGTLGSRLSGIMRQLIINTFPSTLTDAFGLATTIPNALRELLVEGALVNSFIPVYKALDSRNVRFKPPALAGQLSARC